MTSFPDYFRFAFVRDPAERLQSVYTMFCFSEEPNRQHASKLLIGEDFFRLSFQEFCARIKTVGNCHWEVAHRFLPKKENGKIDLHHLGRLETVDEDWRKISSEIGIKEALPTLNKSQRSKNPEIQAMAKEAAKDLYSEDLAIFGY